MKMEIPDCGNVLRGADFYRPVHEVIFDAMIDLYGRGEPSDPITVANELQRRGELARIGGAPYLHTLSANLPIAANAGYYAEIVREKAILRLLVDAGTRIVQMDTPDRASSTTSSPLRMRGGDPRRVIVPKEVHP